jgi:anti-sigma regulatory factor (Ser/Thr protein kinase)
VVDGTRTIPGDLGALAEVRTWAVGLAAAGGLGDRQLGELELALTEAVSNVIRHAKAEDHPIDLHLEIDARELRVLIADRGEFWSGEGASGPRDDGGGYGVDLIAEIMDRVERRPRPGGGTELLLVMERRD